MNSTKDVIVAEKNLPNTEATNTPRRIRLTPRRQNEASGPLAHINGMAAHLPDFHLYLASENDPNNPNEVEYLTSDEVCYEFVHPKEVHALNADGTPMKGDKVRFSYKGLNSVLLKLPMETWKIDLAERAKDDTIRQKVADPSDSKNLVVKLDDLSTQTVIRRDASPG